MPTEEEIKNVINLDEHRRRRDGEQSSSPKKGKAAQTVKDAVGIAKAVSDPFILRFARIGDWPYFVAWLLALLKDLLDLVGIGSLPAIGTVITICVSITAFLLSLLVDTGKAKMVTKMFTKVIILLSGTTVEFLFGLNFVPWETAAVSMMYLLTLQERKTEKKNKKSNEE